MWKGGHADFFGGSDYGGWEFNMADTYRHRSTDEAGNVVLGSMYSADEMLGVSQTALQHVPFFDPGGSAMASLYADQTGSEFAENNRARLLAEMIPALSAPAGANSVDSIPSSQNINMQGQYSSGSGLQNGWPEARCERGDWRNGRWLHGDYRTVAYVYTYRVFDKMSREIGRFDQK